MGDGAGADIVRFVIPAQEGEDGDEELSAGKKYHLGDIVREYVRKEDLVPKVVFVAAVAERKKVKEKGGELYPDEIADEDNRTPLNRRGTVHWFKFKPKSVFGKGRNCPMNRGVIF